MVVIDKLRAGHSLTSACRAVRMAPSTVREHCRKHEELGKLFDDAVQEGEDMMAEALLEPFSHEVYGETDATKASIRSANIKWILAKKRPEKFGDKVTVQSGGVDAAIIGALNEAIKRIPLPDQHYGAVVDAEFSVVVPVLVEEDVDPASLF